MTRSRSGGQPSSKLPSLSFLVAVVFVVLVLAVSESCAKEARFCTEGLSKCPLTCADLTSDSQNCGACGVTCGAGQICQSGRCQCQAGATQCGDRCVATASDPANCGGCAATGEGRVCSANQVCDQGQCKTSCTSPSFTQCGQSCVDLTTDVNNCGRCERSCQSVQSCHRGMCTYDVIAACFNTGEVVGIQGVEPHGQGPRSRLGSFPQTLGTLYDVLLVADGIDQFLRQARLADFSPLPGEDRLGASPNHLWVEDPYVYVVNSLGNTLQILQRQASPADAGVLDGGIRVIPDGGLFPDGLQLITVGQLPFGPSTSPQSIVKVGDDLFIPLWQSGEVAQVNVADPRAPAVTRTFDLGDLDLRPFDRPTFPRPGGIASAWGKIFVALANLDATFSPGGPGIVARIDPARGAVDALYLGADVCLNAFWVAASDDALYVSCSGKATYGPSFELIDVEKSGVVVLDRRGERISTWNVACAEGESCIPPSVGRFAVFSHRLFLGDQAGGRVFVVESDGGQLIERRGHHPVDGGRPIPACVRDSGRLSLVIDVIAVP